MNIAPLSASQILMASGQVPRTTLFGWDGRLLTSDQLHSPVDFGPGEPLKPRIQIPNYAPREYQYEMGQNLIVTPRTETGKDYTFAQLRAWAAACPYYALAVKYRKDQVRARKWAVVPVEDSKSPAARRKHQKEIDRVEGFLRQPNKVDHLGLSQWVGQALEESLKIDALVFHKQWHFDGSLSYVQIDGETIKPIIDTWGHVVGYQQILYGYPATQYHAPVLGDYSVGELAYWVLNPRVGSVYGTSAIEEILPVILTAIKRSQSQLDWYTAGTVPDAFLSSPEGWTPDQIAKYQTWLDNELSDSRARRRLRILPHGNTYQAAKPFQFTKDEEDAIAALILAHMGVPKMVLVSQVNRATAEAQQSDSEDIGLAPLIKWLEENLTSVIQDDLGAKELMVLCTDGMSGQDARNTERFAKLLTAGVMRPDEVRAELGMDPLEAEQATGTAADKIAPEYLTRAIFEAGVITRDELRATLGLSPAPEGGEQYVTIGAFSATPPEAIADAAAGAPVAPAPFGAPKPGGQNAAVKDAVVADAMAALTESPAAKSERAAWRRFALGRFAKGQHGAAFESVAIAAADSAAIRSALGAARTREDVAQAFEKAKAPKLTEAKKEKAVSAIKAATMALFARQYGEVMAHAKEALGA